MARRISNTFKAIINNLKNSNILNYTAQLSYGLTLAFVPILMLFNFAVHFLSSYTEIQVEISEYVTEYFPQVLASIVLPVINSSFIDTIDGFDSLISNFTLLFFIIYASHRLVRSLMLISTKIMREKEDRSIVQVYLIALRYLLQIVIFLVILFAVYLEGSFLVGKVRILWVQDMLQLILTILFAFGFILVLTWIMARFPAQKLKIKEALPGASFTALTLTILFFIDHYVLSHLDYPGYIQLASQGLQMILIIYIISFVFLVGFTVNYTFLEEERFEKKFK